MTNLILSIWLLSIKLVFVLDDILSDQALEVALLVADGLEPADQVGILLYIELEIVAFGVFLTPFIHSLCL